MLRFVFVICVSIFSIIIFLWGVSYIERHGSQYTEEYRYEIAQRVVDRIKKNGFIETKVYGKENLPNTGGYIMYSNHQGKYDALGIIYGHEKPCTVMIDEKRSRLLIADQFISLIKGCRIDRTSIKTQIKAIKQVTDEVSKGRRYIIFPEGGYEHNHNNVQEFLPGAFKCAINSGVPIVPVALIDSYKPFEINSLRKVTTQVHYLPPIEYEQYKDMKTSELAEFVRKQIVDKIECVI